MSVDAEGHDLNVLRSSDWVRYRPELVLVEDFALVGSEPTESAVYGLMNRMNHEPYAWIHPTAIYRLAGGHL